MNLQLSLKKKWFEMTKSGIKTEDYREITPYWLVRLLGREGHYSKESQLRCCENLLNERNAYRWNLEKGYAEFKEFETNIMTLGYPKSTDSERILKTEHKGIEIRTGNPEWGAEPDKLYFVIKHGKIISK